MSMGITQMNSLLSSQNTLKQISNLNTSRVSLTGSSRVLASEIEIDKGRGVDTAKKEEELTKMEDGIKSTTENIGSSITDLNERISSDSEKIREEEAEQKSQAQKAEDKSATSKTEKTGAAVSTGTITNADISSEITEPAVVVEISPEAKVAASNMGQTEHVSASAHRVHVTSANKKFDVKVRGGIISPLTLLLHKYWNDKIVLIN